MRPRILEKARHKVIELVKTIGKWIIKGLESIGRHHPPTVGPLGILILMGTLHRKGLK